MKPLGLDRWWIIPSNPKAILGKTSQKRSLWSSLVIFEGRILGKNRQFIKFEFVILWRGLGRLVITSPTVQTYFRDQLIEIILLFGCQPYLFANQFSLLFLAKQDPYFQDLKLIVRGYKAKDIWGSRGSILDTFGLCTQTLILI